MTKIWKPLVKFKKQREEHAWHSDFSLEEGESIEWKLPDGSVVKEKCPKGKELKLHIEICCEEFEK